jgi:hypothetical protein
MSDAADYVVTAQIVAKDASMPGVDAVGSRLAGLERRALNFGSFLARGFAVVAGGAGLGGILRGIVSLNSSLDESQRGMATLFTAFTGAPIEQSFGRARGVVRALATDAKKGVGELSNYVEGFQKIFGATGGKASDKLVRELTKNSLAAGFALRGDEGLRLAPMDIAQALSGGVSRTETPIVMTALQSVGVSSAKFNAMKMAEKLETLNKAFAGFGPGVELMGKSWSAQFSTLTDNLKDLARSATGPLFERWTDALRRMNGWLERNSDRITTLANTVGGRLAAAWEQVLGHMREAAALSLAMGVGKAAAGVAAAGPDLLSSISGLRFRGEGGKFRKTEWGDLLSGAGLKGLGSAGIGKAVAALTSAAPMLLLIGVVAGGFMALFSAMEHYPELTNLLSRDFGSLGAHLGMLVASLARLFGFMPNVTGVFDAIGIGIGLFLDGLTILADDLVKIATFITRLVEGAVDSIRMSAAVWGAVLSGDFQRAGAIATANSSLSKARLGYALAAFGEPGAKVGGAAPGETEMPVATGNTYIDKVEVAVKAEVNEDPARVGVAWGEFLGHLDRYRTQPRRPVRPPGR